MGQIGLVDFEEGRLSFDVYSLDAEGFYVLPFR
jgi:hypothetical protein